MTRFTTFDWIIHQVMIRTARGVDRPLAAQAIVVACDNVLKSPTLPGDWWGEQIVLEAARLLKEKP